MSIEVARANQIIVLGHSFEIDNFGYPELADSALSRLNRVYEYYVDNLQYFNEEGSVIVCSGWQTPIQAGRGVPAYFSESEESRAYLCNKGVPSRLLRAETESTDSLTNIANSLYNGFIDWSKLSPERPLGLVSQPHHLKRALFFAGKLGVSKECLLAIPTHNADHAFREYLTRTAWRGILAGASGHDQILFRHDKISASSHKSVVTQGRHLLKKVKV